MKRVKEMSIFLQQRVNILFCVKMNYTARATKDAIHHVYGVTALSEKQIRVWYRRFVGGRTEVCDLCRDAKPKTGRSQANIAAVRAAVEADRRATVEQLSKDTEIPPASVHRILKMDLLLVKKCAKYVPRLLTDRHVFKRRNNAEYLLRLFCQFPQVLECAITMDESWVYQYDPLHKAQSREWLHKEDPRPIKAICARATGKVLISTFFDSKGLVYYEFSHKTVNAQCFLAMMERFLEAHRTRRPRGRVRGRLFLHLDNAPCHNANICKEMMRTNMVQRLPHAPYSPDLAPNDFWFFGRLKENLRGTRFPTKEDLMNAVADEITAIPSIQY